MTLALRQDIYNANIGQPNLPVIYILEGAIAELSELETTIVLHHYQQIMET